MLGEGIPLFAMSSVATAIWISSPSQNSGSERQGLSGEDDYTQNVSSERSGAGHTGNILQSRRGLLSHSTVTVSTSGNQTIPARSYFHRSHHGTHGMPLNLLIVHPTARTDGDPPCQLRPVNILPNGFESRRRSWRLMPCRMQLRASLATAHHHAMGLPRVWAPLQSTTIIRVGTGRRLRSYGTGLTTLFVRKSSKKTRNLSRHRAC